MQQPYRLYLAGESTGNSYNHPDALTGAIYLMSECARASVLKRSKTDYSHFGHRFPPVRDTELRTDYSIIGRTI